MKIIWIFPKEEGKEPVDDTTVATWMVPSPGDVVRFADGSAYKVGGRLYDYLKDNRMAGIQMLLVYQ
ncbi:hypothetical protein HX867_02705 [Pseudomonas gingeri]|uniref:hypothetical protein n=1 Tax=Pseudomonas TaxID=286 RepID=UPI0015A0A5A4|nr:MULTISPECIES: hypothetical protein [Pseudomonas]NVZ60985.1 hypothetical protein [Pseudomonas gingeri]NVZ78582.1 hypothetical protein [Pseudomonas gingeri]